MVDGGEIDVGCRETYSAVSAALVAVEMTQQDRRKLEGSRGKGCSVQFWFGDLCSYSRLELCQVGWRALERGHLMLWAAAGG
eukprot:COSAG02_NODE_7929_length_2781_cov_57.738628_2_plen_82_part_00